MSLFLRMQSILLAGSSRVPRHGHHTAKDTPGDLDNIHHSPDALGNRGHPNRDFPDHFTPHSTGPYHSPLLPPATTDPGLLPNTFLLGMLLDIFPVVHLGLQRRQ